MKKIILLISLVLGAQSFAGGMLQIPVELLALDHQGQSQFIANAMAASGIQTEKKVRYVNLRSIVVGGDEDGSDHKGALFIYEVKLESRENDFKTFHCSQYLAVGTLDQKYTRPIECTKL